MDRRRVTGVHGQYRRVDVYCAYHAKLHCDESDDLAARIPKPKERTIPLEHRAWLSVDATGVEGEPDTAIAYAKISRASAELADHSVLGHYHPATNRLTA